MKFRSTEAALVLALSLQPAAAALEKYYFGVSAVYYTITLLWFLLYLGPKNVLSGGSTYGPVIFAVLASFIARAFADGSVDSTALADASRILLAWMAYSLGASLIQVEHAELNLGRLAMMTISLTVAGQVAASLLGIRFAPTGYELADYRYALVGLTKHPSITAALLLSSLPLLLLRPMRRWKAIALFLGAFAAVMTFRRSAWLFVAVIAISVCVAEVVRARRSPARILTFVGIGLCLVLALPLAFELIPQSSPVARLITSRMNDIFGQAGTASGRTVFWPLALQLFNAGTTFDQFFGIGSPAVMAYMRGWFGISIGAHNDLLNILVARGILAATALVWLMYKLATVSFLAAARRTSPAWAVSGGVYIASLALFMSTGGIFDPQYLLLHLFFGAITVRKTPIGHTKLAGAPNWKRSRTLRLTGITP